MFKEITPAGYVEGAYMLLKDNKYYFMWSEGGWTGPNYAVAYAIGTSPFGPFERVGKILQQDSTVATAPGITRCCARRLGQVVHRVPPPPLGERDRNHRVVSIDELRFDERGLIQPVKITKEGVRADSLPPSHHEARSDRGISPLVRHDGWRDPSSASRARRGTSGPRRTSGP
jgi:hypothetical protein